MHFWSLFKVNLFKGPKDLKAFQMIIFWISLNSLWSYNILRFWNHFKVYFETPKNSLELRVISSNFHSFLVHLIYDIFKIPKGFVLFQKYIFWNALKNPRNIHIYCQNMCYIGWILGKYPTKSFYMDSMLLLTNIGNFFTLSTLCT